jgi:hypothetical protein
MTKILNLTNDLMRAECAYKNIPKNQLCRDKVISMPPKGIEEVCCVEEIHEKTDPLVFASFSHCLQPCISPLHPKLRAIRLGGSGQFS